MVELMISVGILTLCCGMLASTLSSTGMLRRTNLERAVAVEAARGVIEDMHNCEYGIVFETFNDDPLDDPGGAGSAPGKHFQVEGLAAAALDLDGFVGEVVFPTNASPLLESVVDEGLTMPRDLNGDMMIDDEDHAADHVVLPVRVIIQWKGRGGERYFEMQTMLSSMEIME
ncbi:MAG: hypothetical protein ACI9F9_000400 [Candidatus Paceibacteria bacterium]|jgi:hypothetical protein